MEGAFRVRVALTSKAVIQTDARLHSFKAWMLPLGLVTWSAGPRGDGALWEPRRPDTSPQGTWQSMSYLVS